MALPSTGAISLNDLRTEYTTGGAVSLSDFYRGGSNVLNNYGDNASIPTTGAVSLDDFHGNYVEGTTLQKLANWREHRNNGLIYAGQEGTDGVMVTVDSLNVGANPVGRYQSSDEIVNAGATRSALSATSRWTSCFGIAAAYSNSVRTDPIVTSFAENQVYNSTSVGEANCVCDQVNGVHRDIGDIAFTFTRSAGNNWGNGLCFVVAGKWNFDRSTTASSVVLQSGELICWAKTRDGDGYSTGSYQNSHADCTFNVVNGWWYNTGFVGVSTNGSTTAQTFSIVGEGAPDQAWIFKEQV